MDSYFSEHSTGKKTIIYPGKLELAVTPLV